MVVYSGNLNFDYLLRDVDGLVCGGCFCLFVLLARDWLGFVWLFCLLIVVDCFVGGCFDVVFGDVCLCVWLYVWFVLVGIFVVIVWLVCVGCCCLVGGLVVWMLVVGVL